jgi:hypothetical protein
MKKPKKEKIVPYQCFGCKKWTGCIECGKWITCDKHSTESYAEPEGSIWNKSEAFSVWHAECQIEHIKSINSAKQRTE